MNKDSSGSMLLDFWNKIKLKEIMTTPVISVKEDDHFSKVEQKLRENEIRHLPVVDKDKKLVGLITERNLYKIKSPRKRQDGSMYYDSTVLDRFILKNVMTTKVFSLHPKDTMVKAIHSMGNEKYGCIPIVDQDHVLVGIITQVDILKIVSQVLEK